MPTSPIIFESKHCCSILKMIRRVFFHFSIELKLHPVGSVKKFLTKSEHPNIFQSHLQTAAILRDF